MTTHVSAHRAATPHRMSGPQLTRHVWIYIGVMLAVVVYVAVTR